MYPVGQSQLKLLAPVSWQLPPLRQGLGSTVAVVGGTRCIDPATDVARLAQTAVLIDPIVHATPTRATNAGTAIIVVIHHAPRAGAATRNHQHMYTNSCSRLGRCMTRRSRMIGAAIIDIVLTFIAGKPVPVQSQEVLFTRRYKSHHFGKSQRYNHRCCSGKRSP